MLNQSQKNKTISDSTCKTLGGNLNIKCDTLHKKHNSKTYNSTKQRVFGFFCSISDPLGIIAFCLIEPKLIVQDSWRRKIGWNARLLQDLKERFAKQNQSQITSEKLRYLDTVRVILMKPKTSSIYLQSHLFKLMVQPPT